MNPPFIQKMKSDELHRLDKMEKFKMYHVTISDTNTNQKRKLKYFHYDPSLRPLLWDTMSTWDLKLVTPKAASLFSEIKLKKARQG